ncbi:MAG TPA: energy transducer TonB [Verrucomicrobiae bacterium]|nr:energy transducer TonB [Verrucomicrobiae bacterium]
MAATRPLRLAPEWDERFTRMVGLSALGHALVLAAVVLFAGRLSSRPLPMVAYTVELTDPSALGGRLPPGPPGPDLSGGPTTPPAPPPKAEPVEPAKPPEPKPEPKPAAEEATVHVPEKPKLPEPPKAEVKKPEPPKPPPKAEVKPPEPPKVAATKPEPPKPPPAKQTEPPKATAARPSEEAVPHDAYGAAAERWRQRVGGGVGGNEAGSGPIGSGGEGKGGGGQLVGLEFIAYRQQVINTIKAQWTNVIARPGLVAAVRFEIAPDGQVSNVRLAQSSGNPAYDASTLRAVQHVAQLPPPPARYVSEFREFVIEFHSEESGGRGAG